MVVRAYTVCIGVTPECRWMELEMIGDGWGHADEAYHDTLVMQQWLCAHPLMVHQLSLWDFSIQ